MLLPQRVPEGVAALPEDEFASRLALVVPALNGASRAELLHALFPVPSASEEEPTAPLLALAIARAGADGSLKARVHDFLLRRPLVLEQLGHPPPAARRLAIFEGAAWLFALGLVCTAGFRAVTAPTVAEVRAASHAALATQATPALPAADLPGDGRYARRTPAHGSPPAPPAFAGTPSQGVAVAKPRSHPTPFHNVSFAGYFTYLRHTHSVARQRQKKASPAPSPTPAPRPRVHSLFGPIFGSHG